MIEVILWCAGFMVSVTVMKFIYLVFKRLSSRNSIEAVIDKMEDGMANAANKVATSIKDKKKQKEQPVVTIR